MTNIINIRVTKYYYVRSRLDSISGPLASTLGLANPLRYRGYCYDGETGLYYLNSRYYNLTWCRFISEDIAEMQPAAGDTVSGNLYAYCDNNPVMASDPSGHFIFSFIKNGLISIVKAFAQDWIENTIFNLVMTFGGAFAGAVKGFKAAKAFNKSLLFTKRHKNVFLSTVVGFFKGMLTGFFAGIGVGKISNIMSGLKKYCNFEAMFDRTPIGKWIDNRIRDVENALIWLIKRM